MDRQLRAVEQHLLAARDPDRREVLDLQIADLVSVVLDVEPAELGARKLLRELEEPRPVSRTNG